MNYSFDTFGTSMGDFSLAIDESGAVIAAAFGGKTALARRGHAREFIRDPHRVAPARREIEEFLNGQRQTFTLKLMPAGTAFQKRIWSALQRIPFGQTRSYGQLAAKAGRPRAARAVGQAVATNPICLAIPCHRVIASDGSLGGFAFGPKLKRRLLSHETAFLSITNDKSAVTHSQFPPPRATRPVFSAETAQPRSMS